MSWSYIDFEFPVSNTFEKELLWISADCHIYFAFKLKSTDDWTFYSGNASHELETGKLLTNCDTVEATAQTNYFQTVKDSNGKVLAILPIYVEAKYARVYIETGSAVTIYEWIPSVKLLAHEIISGTLEITDDLSDAPLITVNVSDVDRLKIGNLYSTSYGIAGFDSSSATIFELSDSEQQIGGWDFNASQLTKNDTVISSNGRIRVGTGDDVARIDAQDATYRLWIGHDSAASAPFSVTKAGILNADGANITGTLNVVTINASQVVAGEFDSDRYGENTITGTPINASAINTTHIRTDAVTANEINVASLSAISADLGTITAGLAKSSDDTFQVDFTNKWLKVYDASSVLRVHLGFIE